MNNQAGMEGEVLIQINPDQGLANITMRAYNFNPVSEWFGIGISYDQQMVCNILSLSVLGVYLSIGSRWKFTEDGILPASVLFYVLS